MPLLAAASWAVPIVAYMGCFLSQDAAPLHVRPRTSSSGFGHASLTCLFYIFPIGCVGGLGQQLENSRSVLSGTSAPVYFLIILGWKSKHMGVGRGTDNHN